MNWKIERHWSGPGVVWVHREEAEAALRTERELADRLAEALGRDVCKQDCCTDTPENKALQAHREARGKG